MSTQEPTPETRDAAGTAPVEPDGGVVAAPSLDEIDELRRSIEERVEAGDAAGAASALSALHPSDAAPTVAAISEERQSVLAAAMSPELLAHLFEEMEIADAVQLSSMIGDNRAAEVLDDSSPDVAADVLRSMEWEQASRILARMRDRKSVGSVIIYADDDAGGLMSPEVAALRESATVHSALTSLRMTTLPSARLQQLFVVDSEGVLVGQLNLSDLVFAPHAQRVSELMEPYLVSVETGADQEEAVRLMSRYGIRSLPVVDRAGHLEGAIAIEDLVGVAEAEATEDMFKMFGLGAEDRATGPVWLSVRTRFPWLVVNLGTVLLAGFLLSLFSSTIENSIILAAFVPVVAGQAGIAGTQTLTLIVRALALGEVTGRDTRRLLMREGMLAVLQGLAMSVLLGGIVWGWQSDLYLGLVVAGAMLANLVVAALGGVLVPLGMRALRIDPATSSAVVVTTLTDNIGIVVYLSLATAFLTTFRAG